jgi:ABC-type dipeptide/oligopeptide/nickel transport system ATPase component
MAVLHRPALLIADEATSALDIVTQAEILSLFRKLNREMAMSILYISHDLLSVATISHRISVMKDGVIVESDSARNIFCNPQHPYTRALVASLPVPPMAITATDAQLRAKGQAAAIP